MPVFFRKVEGRWEATPAPHTRCLLFLAPFRIDSAADRCAVPRDACLLVRIAPDERWILLATGRQRLLHNGQNLFAGLRVLAHMDSVALAGEESVYFSTEETARVERYTGSARTSCPRCRSEVSPGQPAVKCPRCGVFHHETAERNCWSYAPTCAVCPQPTPLGLGLQWTPGAL